MGVKRFQRKKLSWRLILVCLINQNCCLFFMHRIFVSKMILDRPMLFGRVLIVLNRSNSFWSCPNHFEQVQNIKVSQDKSNLNLIKMIWTKPKQFVPVQNSLNQSFLRLKANGPFHGLFG